ncbi:MAG: PAS domain S-box protein [Proteobacteria bacterium]|nr:PAS domain S-box protein [Desulfobulbaceae bacterium]MBU4151349.1 PAS domain S-box protein [Pseudomonadota bacterium]
MKSALGRSLITLFSAMAILALCAGVLVISGIRHNSQMTHVRTSLTNLQLEIKKLQLLQNQESSITASPLPVETARKTFLTLKQLAWTIDTLGREQTSTGKSYLPSLVKQLDSLRDTYVNLLSSVNEYHKNHQINQELFALINQRISLPTTSFDETIQQNLELLQTMLVVDTPKKEAPTSQMKTIEALFQDIAYEISDPSVNKALKTIQNNYHQSVNNQVSIRTQEQMLSTMSTVFTTHAEETINSISSSLATKEAWRNSLICLILLALIATILLTFGLIRKRLHLFQHHASLIMKSIRSGHFDYQPELFHDDEMTTHLQFLTEVSYQLAQQRQIISEYHQRWQTLFNTMTEWVLTCDTNGICTASNHRAKEMTGFDADRLINQPLATVLEGHAGATLNIDIAQALADQKEFDSLDHHIQHINGSLIPAVIKGQPIIDAAGHWQGLTLLISNLSKEHHAEALLTQATRATKFLNMILELALLNIELPELLDRFIGHLINLSWIGVQPKAAFFLIDKNTHCLTMAAQRGIDSQVITSCALLPLGACLCGRVAQSGKIIFADCHDPRHEMNYPGMAIHGHYCLPVHTVAGEIIGVVVLYLEPTLPRDHMIEAILITATTMIGSIIRRRQTEDALKSLNQNLEQRIEARTAQLTAANQELDSFSYSVSHDLRAPLRAIDGFSLALYEDYGSTLPPQAHDSLARIRSGCSRMESLINDLLNLSRLSRFELKRNKVNLSQMAIEISEEIRAESPHRMVMWHIVQDLEIMADPTMIRAALFNLLANAWKYSKKTASARIELGRIANINDTGQTAFFIRDNGAGFNMRYVDKLFTPFQRLHPEDQFPGNGIGLATVQRIIHLHQGKIWAEGKAGEGATFYFTVSPGD